MRTKSAVAPGSDATTSSFASRGGALRGRPVSVHSRRRATRAGEKKCVSGSGAAAGSGPRRSSTIPRRISVCSVRSTW